MTLVNARSPLMIVASCLLINTPSIATDTTITLNQGATISVTAPEASDRIAFDLAGKIWLLGNASQSAVPLTESGAAHQRPAFARNGQWVAYESVRAGHRQIFVMDVDSGNARQVTFGPYDHHAPTWSTADSRWLTMSSNRGGNFDIWSVDIDNLELRQLTFSASDEHDPAWNDDGSRLAYVAASARGSSLYILTPGDKPKRVLQEREPIAAPAWRPGGGLLTYVRLGKNSNQLRMLLLSSPPISKPVTQHEQVSPRAVHWIDRSEFLYAADGKIRRRSLGLAPYADIPFSVTININRNERSARTVSPAGHDNQPVRGLNGQTERSDGRYVVAALGDLWEFQHQDNGELLLVRQLTNDAYVDAQPAFSPTGQSLVFVSDRSGRPEIWVMDHGSLEKRRLTRDAGVAGHPTWSPDGDFVTYLVTDDEAGYRLHQVNVTTRRIQALTATSRHRGKPRIAGGSWAIPDKPETQLDTLIRFNRQSVPLTWRPAVAGQRYIVRAGRIFDGIGPEYKLHHEIVIERDLIVAIRPWSNTEPETPVVDATTHTVIPGLIDLAVLQGSIDDERNGREWLAAGVTTIRQTVTDFDQAVERLESWNSGRRIGPRLMLTVRPCHTDSGRFNAPLFQQLTTDTAALNIVAIELCTDLTGPALADVFERAHQVGLSVIATTPDITMGADELRSPAAARSIQGSPTELADQRDTLLIMGMAGTALPSQLIVDPNRILGADGHILPGSGAPTTPRGLGLHAELRRLTTHGLQPFQVLKMASLDAARVLGYGDSLGIVRVGRRADLVILDGDPLADIHSASRVVGTIVRGRYYSRRDLTTPGLRALARNP